jgi:hypothetical protein
VIADFDVTEKMLRYFVTKVHEGRHWVKPQVVIAVPVGITPVERRAVIHSAERAGARRVYLIDEPMAAGIGCESCCRARPMAIPACSSRASTRPPARFPGTRPFAIRIPAGSACRSTGPTGLTGPRAQPPRTA